MYSEVFSIFNIHVFYYTGSSYNPNTNISGWGVVFSSRGEPFESQYSFNTELVANSLTPYKPIYLVGTVGEDGLYYLDEVWWTQIPTTEGKVYVLVGACYDSTTSYCRITLYENNRWYVYDGEKLQDFNVGSMVSKVDVEYYLSTSSTSLSGGSWQTTAPTWVDGKYMWSRTKITDGAGKVTYAPSENGTCIAGATGSTGATGKGVSSIVEQYYKSTSATSLSGGSWSTTYPGWENGKYIWTRSVISYTDNSTPTTTTAVCVTGQKGDTGAKGDKGDKGDTGPQGNPTGITVSATEPTSKFTGMLWKHTGTVSGLVSNATYRWNGSSWELYLFTAENISVNDLAALNATIGGWEIKPGKLQTTYDKNGASDENQIVHNYSTIVSFNTDSDKIINLILTDDVPDSGDGNAITSQVNTYINNLGSFVSRYINDANDPDGYYSEVINEPGMVRVTSHYDLDMETEISAGTVLITCDSDIVRLDYEGLNAPNGSVISNYIYANASYTIGTYEAIGKSGNYAVFGNNSAITRIATKTVSASNTGYSFGIGNGYQAALASSWEQNADIYLCGGQDSTSKFLRSYPIYARTYANAANVVVTGTGIIGRSTSSSIRYKHDVEYYSNAEHRVIDDDHVVSGQMDENELLKILEIPVVSFKYNDGYITGESDYDYDKPVVGFIADDVAKVCPECATYIDIDGKAVPESWDERQMIPRMLYVIQKQQKQIHDMKISHDAEMKKMEEKLSALEREVNEIKCSLMNS